MRYIGEEFVVDADSFTVEFAGEPADLEPQAIDLLLYMLAHRDQMLTKEVLLDEVWGDQFVGESALTTRIKQLRRALGDDGRAQRVIRTVHGKGYRFVADVEESAADSAESGPAADDSALRNAGRSHGDARPARAVSTEHGAAPKHNIPPARTELVGRRGLIETIDEAVTGTRLVSLVGFGGAGKTSVANAVGRRLADRGDVFDDGAWFVDLIGVHDADGIDRAVARGIGAQLNADTGRDGLLQLLARRRALLILDNCEHVADPVAEFCSALLDSTVAPHVLATSRVPLHVVGEHRIPVGPLPVIDANGGALDLLDQVAARAGVAIPTSERVAALDLCNRVDGLPLAIELVGARLTTLSVREILDRLDQLGVAATGDRRPERHSALATVLADTVATLEPDDVRLLTLLGRVEGSFGIDDVEGLAAAGRIHDGDDAFARLVERSLLVTTSPSPRRHALLETVRQYAAAHDPSPPATADAHARWCLDAMGTSLGTHFYDLRHADWVAERFDDLVLAHDHLAASGREPDAVRLLGAMGLAMHLDDGSRAAQFLRRLDGHAPLDDPDITARRHCAGVMAAMAVRSQRGMYEHGLAAVEAADSTGDASLKGLARVMRSWAGVVIDVEQALADLDDAIALADTVDDAATALIATGYKVTHLAMGLRFDDAIEIGTTALERTPPDATSYPRRVAATGMLCSLVVDDPETSLRLDEEVRQDMSVSFWGTNIVRAAAHASLGHVDEVVSSVRILEERLDRSGVSPLPDLLLVPASLAHQLGDDERASRCLGAIRRADQPTQSLMVSTAYRALRNHIPAAEPGASTDDVWNEARAWMDDLVETAEAAEVATP